MALRGSWVRVPLGPQILMKIAEKVKIFLALMWTFSGLSKFLALLAERFTGRAMVTNSFYVFAKLCPFPFYVKIINQYFIPRAAFFIFLAALSEIVAGLLIFQKRRVFIRTGLILAIAMDIVYAPLAGTGTMISNLFLILIQLWLFRREDI